ncbi:RsmB/NOP family class I SAM-dependent RNA methyltransferase [Simulacricoccus sp. 17bor-14]|nr:RsmB/NOP family class I SAM-dependent RNA methyltransferase [Simulacricoccus sp. 17bor-14]
MRAQPWEALSGLAEVAGAAIARVLGGTAAERVLDRTLRDHRALGSEQRRALVEAVFNVGLWRRRLVFHLRGGEPSAAAHLFALLHALAGVSAPEAARLAGLPEPLPLRLEEPEALALRHSLPDWLAEHLVRELGEEADALCAHLNVPAPITLRTNTLRTTRDALAARLEAEGLTVTPGRYSPLALHVQGPGGARPNLYGIAAGQEGLFEVQDEGSQLLGLLMEARPGDSVLDLCAGAGGKTLQLGAAMGDTGRLLAYDPDAGRLDRLLQRAARAGLRRLELLRAPPGPELQVDRVLVDAPCSELGTLRRGPDLRFRLGEDALTRWLPVQAGLLRDAARHVRPGGRLVYATCTLNGAENAAQVASFLTEHPDFHLVRPTGVDSSLLQGDFLATFPHRHGTDGFFAAVLERADARPLHDLPTR